MKTIYTTKNGKITVDVETGRQKSADGEFFAMLEGREPKMIDLPDAYHVRPVVEYGQRIAYCISEDREEAIRMAEDMSTGGTGIDA